MENSANVEVLEAPSRPVEGRIRSIVEFMKGTFSLISPYWRSKEKMFAWSSLIGVISLSFTIVYISVQINGWQGEFYNTLQQLDQVGYTQLLYKFCGLVVAMIAAYVSKEYLQEYLVFRWRIWFTRNMLGRWMQDSTFCKLFTVGAKTENPDQRISEDLLNFTHSSMMFFIGIIKETVNAISFGIILWALSEGVSLAAFGLPQVSIPGYMLWLTVIYVTFATFFVFKTGKPLVQLDYIQEKVEANFRFGLMRIRDRRNEVAILGGEKSEGIILSSKISDIVDNFKNIIVRRVYVNTFQNLFLNATTVLPLIAAAPMFFAGAIDLGGLMRLAAAFSAVEMSLMYFVMNVSIFAQWKANFNRIVDFSYEMDTVHSLHNDDLRITYSNPRELKVNLELDLPDGSRLFDVDFSVAAGERVLVMGRSGLGKSTLTKAIVGQWPYAKGLIEKPEKLLVMPQKPYFPISNLRDAVLYPHIDSDVADSEIKNVLKTCKLEQLCDSLFLVNDWNAVLSLGEQQRLNFARIILSKPSFLIVDEPTASMNKELELYMFNALIMELSETSILTISHSEALKALHSRVINVAGAVRDR